jgi:CIC family chloride channel protein
MDTDVALAPADMSFEALLALPEHRGRLRNVVVFDEEHIFGVLRVGSSLLQAAHLAETSPTLRDIVSRRYTVVHEEDVVYDVIRGMWRAGAMMAIVVRAREIPVPRNVLGVITKEQIADSVAGSVKVYASGD